MILMVGVSPLGNLMLLLMMVHMDRLKRLRLLWMVLLRNREDGLGLHLMQTVSLEYLQDFNCYCNSSSCPTSDGVSSFGRLIVLEMAGMDSFVIHQVTVGNTTQKP